MNNSMPTYLVALIKQTDFLKDINDQKGENKINKKIQQIYSY